MIRVLLILALIALGGIGFAWIADRPGDIILTWQGVQYQTSLVVGLVALVALVVLLSILWSILRFFIRLPSLVAVGHALRRREKALRALTRGMIAAGAGDTRAARRAAAEAERHLPEEPLTLLLKAQAAQLAGDRAEADRTFARMAEKPETRLLGLRGLHVEARRRGDVDAAHHYATEAHALAPVDWAGSAVLEHHATQGDWDKALAAVDANQAHKLIDRRAANRQRAVIKTAQAMDLGDRDPDRVIALAREAVKLAPELVPAIVVAGRALSRRGDIRAAAKTLEAGFGRVAHPDIAAAYLDVRPGDSSRDRLARAETLARLDAHAPESCMTVARAALDARDFARAREAMASLTGPGTQPTRRMCLIMADIEETEHGRTGALREWLARAARAPRDAAWVADGLVSDVWAPVSPVTGRLDAFEWKVPPEQLAAPLEPLPEHFALQEPEHEPRPAAALAPAIEHVAAPSEDAEAVPAPEPSEAAEPARVEQPAAVPPGVIVSEAVSHEPPRRPMPTPVLFPQATAPDDPGPPRVRGREDGIFL